MNPQEIYLILKGIMLLCFGLAAVLLALSSYSFIKECGWAVYRTSRAFEDAIREASRRAEKERKAFRKQLRHHTVADNRELFEVLSSLGTRMNLHYVNEFLENTGEAIDFNELVPEESFPLVVTIKENKHGDMLNVEAVFVEVLPEDSPETQPTQPGTEDANA